MHGRQDEAFSCSVILGRLYRTRTCLKFPRGCSACRGSSARRTSRCYSWNIPFSRQIPGVDKVCRYILAVAFTTVIADHNVSRVPLAFVGVEGRVVFRISPFICTVVSSLVRQTPKLQMKGGFAELEERRWDPPVYNIQKGERLNESVCSAVVRYRVCSAPHKCIRRSLRKYHQHTLPSGSRSHRRHHHRTPQLLGARQYP